MRVYYKIPDTSYSLFDSCLGFTRRDVYFQIRKNKDFVWADGFQELSHS